MRPVDFKEANFTYESPDDMKDCGRLRVWRGEEFSISRWSMTWKERILCLLFGRVWLFVWGGGHPPVLLESKRTVFEEVKKDDR